MKRSLPATLLVALAALSPAMAAPPNPATQRAAASQPTTAVLCALDAEFNALQQGLTDKQVQSILGIRFVTGRLDGRRVVLAVGGVGKVNAALVSTLMVQHFGPHELIFSGIAGGLNPRLGLGDVVIASRTAQHDLLVVNPDTVKPMVIDSPVDGKPNPQFFPADEHLLHVAQSAAADLPSAALKALRADRVPRIVTGTVVTGDTFVASNPKKQELRDRFDADAVEMEGAAVAQVCWQFAVPCLVIRSISDLADDAAHEDVQAFLNAAAHNAATLVRAIVARLEGSAPSTRPSTQEPARPRQDPILGGR